MNDLKYLNDNHGHAAGDEALKTIASILIKEKRNDGETYRVGGDEFVLFYYNNVNEEYVLERIKAMREMLSKTPYTCAFGYAMKKPDSSVEEAITEADARMYADKKEIKENNEQQE